MNTTIQSNPFRKLVILAITILLLIIFPGCNENNRSPSTEPQTNEEETNSENDSTAPEDQDLTAINENQSDTAVTDDTSQISAEPKYVADHTVAKETILRAIPEEVINQAKSDLHIMYCGTSHSSQTTDGMYHLQYYKPGDDTLFAVTFDGNPIEGSLDIHYRPNGAVNVYAASDLSHDSTDAHGYTDYYYQTIEYLDHPNYSDVNVVMWSWCSIEGHNVQIYLDNFAKLIEMYKAGGSKGRTQENQVTFVFMTGYARGNDGDTPEPPYIESPYQNHKKIVDFCKANNYFCLDYWSHDTHHYETDEYYPNAQGNTPVHLLEWMDGHPEDWYECNPAHASDYDLLGNRRAYAAWWIWARISGWEGN